MLSVQKLSLKIYKAQKYTHKIKSRANTNNVSVQESYEKHNHENKALNAHMKFLNMKIIKTKIFIKTKYASKYMYVLSKLKVYIHIPNTNESLIKICMKGKRL